MAFWAGDDRQRLLWTGPNGVRPTPAIQSNPFGKRCNAGSRSQYPVI